MSKKTGAAITSEICVFRNNEPFPIPDPSTKSPIVPSLIAFQRNGETVVGESARKLADTEDRGVREVKRKMGTSERVSVIVGENDRSSFRAEEISALILRKLKETAEGTLNIPVRDVVISVPANFSDAAREATKNAAEIAGLNVLRLINEPTAAALAFGINNLELEEQMIVFDFGGGTLDITVLEMIEGIVDVKCSYGDPLLGGKDIDSALIELVATKFTLDNPSFTLTSKYRDMLKHSCEMTKIELSTRTSSQVYIPNFFVNSGTPIDLDIEITRTEFEQAIEPIIEKARNCIRKTLEAKELRPSSINRILLVGGSTYIPAVRKMVKEMFGKEPSEGVHPDLAVTVGASIQAGLIKGHIDSENGILLTDICPFSLGIDIVTQIGYQEVQVFMPLIERNTKVPFTARYDELTLRYTDQEEVKFNVYQDHSGKAQFPHECEDTGKGGEIKKIPKSTSDRPHNIVIDFSYDADGLAVIKASIPTTGHSLTISHGKFSNRMDEAEIAEATKNISELWKKNEKSKNFEGIIDKAERLSARLSQADRQRLKHCIIELKQALTAGDDDHIAKASDKLIDLMYDLENQ